MELQGDVDHVETRFVPFGDVFSVGARWCTICAKRAIGSEIDLDTPNGTPRCRGSSGSTFLSVWR
jgi:hypothetical protein